MREDGAEVTLGENVWPLLHQLISAAVVELVPDSFQPLHGNAPAGHELWPERVNLRRDGKKLCREDGKQKLGQAAHVASGPRYPESVAALRALVRGAIGGR